MSHDLNEWFKRARNQVAEKYDLDTPTNTRANSIEPLPPVMDKVETALWPDELPDAQTKSQLGKHLDAGVKFAKENTTHPVPLKYSKEYAAEQAQARAGFLVRPSTTPPDTSPNTETRRR